MQERINSLLELYGSNRASRQETEELWGYLEDEQFHPYFEQYFTDNAGNTQDASADKPDWDQLWSLIREKTQIKTIYWKRWAVAASIVIALGLSAFFLQRTIFNSSPGPTAIADVPAPVSTHAKLILQDGRSIALDSLHDGALTQADQATVHKLPDGRLQYDDGVADSEAPVYHTVENPRGSRIVDLTLSDGSRLWLNAGSSIRYPVKFAAERREITLTGEAYFEVAHDAARPFAVTHGNDKTVVLGTKFNVRAYANTQVREITLIQGSVKVISNANSSQQELLLLPGQQAILKSAEISKNSSPDIEKVIAWKSNEFIFDEDPLDQIIPELERWYDVDFSIQKPFSTKYTGRISRTASLSQVLKMFESLGYIKFAILGKKIEVLPAKK